MVGLGKTAGFDLMQSLPVACALIRQANSPAGGKRKFLFMAINGAWESLTGMRPVSARDVSVETALPALEKSGVDWRAFFRRALKEAGNSPEISWADSLLHRRYRMRAVFVREKILAVFLQDAPGGAAVPDSLLWAALNSIHDGVLLLDSRGRVLGLNRAAAEILGRPAEPIEGTSYRTALSLRGGRADPAEEAVRTGRPVTLNGRVKLAGGRGRAVPVTGILTPRVESGGRVAGLTLVFHNAERERERKDAIVYLSYHDHLTGLYNRRFADEEIHRLDVPRQLPLAVIMGDVNGLKISNDVFGHETGDSILRAAAAAIRRSCREEDIVSRWGGDEFLVLLPRTDAVTAEGVIRRIRAQCERSKVGEMTLSISLGCAAKARKSENFWHVLQAAEEKMYHQKLIEGRQYRDLVIRGLLVALPEKSCETDAHVGRLKRYCAAMAGEIGISQDGMADLGTLADLHDIGQVAVAREILCKPGPLTASEWVEVRRHPEIGYRIANSALELSTVAESILCHHEHWDGRGYPRGLDKENIPVVSRLFAVADAYDAMTNDRPYRRAVGEQKAIGELKRCSGSQFDPEMVQIFCRLHEKRAFFTRPQ